MKPEQNKNLRETIDKWFSLSELILLVSDLGIDWDHLEGGEKLSKIQSLISHMQRREALDQLVEAISKERSAKNSARTSAKKISPHAEQNHNQELNAKYHSCFISFSSRDQRFAERLNNSLKENGVQTWFAPHDLKIGARMRQTFDENVQMKHKLLLILSGHSIDSDWVEQEVETALAKERREKIIILFPVRLDDKVFDETMGWPALITNTRNIGDFRNWEEPAAYQNAFQRLLRDLQH